MNDLVAECLIKDFDQRPFMQVYVSWIAKGIDSLYQELRPDTRFKCFICFYQFNFPWTAPNYHLLPLTDLEAFLYIHLNASEPILVGRLGRTGWKPLYALILRAPLCGANKNS